MAGWGCLFWGFEVAWIFQSYHDLETGDTQSLKSQWRDPGSSLGSLAEEAKSLPTTPPLFKNKTNSISSNSHPSAPAIHCLKWGGGGEGVKTRGPKGYISCPWVQCATFLRNRPRRTFLFTDRPEKKTRGPKGHISCTWVQCATFLADWPERPSCFSDRPRKTQTLVEDVEILLPVKFRWIPFRGFRGEVENVSANQRPGRPFCFSDRPEKHKLGRGCWDLPSCKVLSNSIQWFQRRSRKCEKLTTTDGRTTDGRTDGRTDDGQHMITIVHLSLRLRCTKNLVEDIEILLPVKFRWIPFSGFRGEVENVSANQRPGRPSYFFDRPEKHKLGRGRWDLASCQVSLNSVHRFQRSSRKCLSQSKARAAILFFRSARNTHTW